MTKYRTFIVSVAAAMAIAVVATSAQPALADPASPPTHPALTAAISAPDIGAPPTIQESMVSEKKAPDVGDNLAHIDGTAPASIDITMTASKTAIDTSSGKITRSVASSKAFGENSQMRGQTTAGYFSTVRLDC